jgi:hypothetical protein
VRFVVPGVALRPQFGAGFVNFASALRAISTGRWKGPTVRFCEAKAINYPAGFFAAPFSADDPARSLSSSCN